MLPMYVPIGLLPLFMPSLLLISSFLTFAAINPKLFSQLGSLTSTREDPDPPPEVPITRKLFAFIEVPML